MTIIIIILATLAALLVAIAGYFRSRSNRFRSMREDVFRRSMMTIFLCAGIWLASCGRPPTPPPPARAASVPRILLVGGLGDSQFGNTSPNLAALLAAMPQVQVVDFGTPNGYLADIAGYVAMYPNDCDIGIAHSAGCGTLCRAAAAGVKFRKLILLDPAKDSDIILPVGVDVVVFRAGPLPFITPSHVVGLYREERVKEDHNAFLHVPQNIDLIADEVRSAI